MFLLRVLHYEDKRQSQSNQDKETSKGKDEERTREFKKFTFKTGRVFRSDITVVDKLIHI
jgi:hypothetical protein